MAIRRMVPRTKPAHPPLQSGWQASASRPGSSGRRRKRTVWMDIFMIAVWAVFFALAFGYVRLCDTL